MPFAARLLILLLLAPIPAAAETAVMPWGDLEIPNDAAEWRAVGKPDENGRFTLACIAPACSEDQNLFGIIGPATDLVEQPRWRGPEELVLDNPALPFKAYRTWTGCRARDSAILTAAVLHGDHVYSMTASFREGCNFAPEMPAPPFVKLVSSIRPRDWGSLQIGGIRVKYDTGRWSAAPGGVGGGAEGAWLTCTLRQCRDWKGRQAQVRISTSADDGSQCARNGEAAEDFSRDGGSRTFGGLTLHLWKTFSGCRARTPVEQNACGIHGGTAYRFVSGLHAGCSAGIEGVPEALFDELLSGISRAESVPPPP
jgi:hypothetical protein